MTDDGLSKMAANQPRLRSIRDWFGKDWRPDIWLSYAFCTGGVWIGLSSIPEEFSQLRVWISAVEPAPAAFVAFTIGSSVYALYRRFVGELILYPSQHLLHWLITLFGKWTVIGYFNRHHVYFLDRRDAYQIARDYLRRVGEGVEDVNRVEIHIGYLTSIFVSCVAAIQMAAASDNWRE